MGTGWRIVCFACGCISSRLNPAFELTKQPQANVVLGRAHNDFIASSENSVPIAATIVALGSTYLFASGSRNLRSTLD
jgi:hypothetical protein